MSDDARAVDPIVPGTARGRWGRIVLKLSGEAFAGEAGVGIDGAIVRQLAEDIVELRRNFAIDVAVVVGGGNIWRGAQGVARGMEQSTADHIGMIATVMNGLALQDALERLGVKTRVQTAIEMKAVAEPYIRLRAIRHMEKGRVVIIAGGTGNPYFTTDTAAALRAVEVNAEIVIKATKVNGVYSADPKKFPEATRYETLSYKQVLSDRLQVMDMTAFTLCEENKMPILVLDLWSGDDLKRAVLGDHSVGTLIQS